MASKRFLFVISCARACGFPVSSYKHVSYCHHLIWFVLSGFRISWLAINSQTSVPLFVASGALCTETNQGIQSRLVISTTLVISCHFWFVISWFWCVYNFWFKAGGVSDSKLFGWDSCRRGPMRAILSWSSHEGWCISHELAHDCTIFHW